MKKKWIVLFIVLFILKLNMCLFAEEMDGLLQNQINDLDFQEMEELMIRLKQQSYASSLQDFDFKETVKQAALGQLPLSTSHVLKKIMTLLFKEFYYQRNLMGKLIMLSIVCAIMKIFTESFHNKGVAEMGFYAVYTVLIILLFQSFEVAIILVRETVEMLVLIMQALVPTVMSFMLLSGQVSSVSVFHPMILVSVQTIGIVIKTVFIPGIFFVTILAIINQISEKQVLKQWIQLLRQCIQWGLKTITGIFIAVLGLHSITVPLLDNFLHKTTQYALRSVPVVGNALTGAVDTVLNCSLLIKQAVGVGGILLLGLFCITPILKLVTFILLYKFTAALIQPFGEERIVRCITCIGEGYQLLLGCLCMIVILFIVNITMMIGMTNLGTMVR